MKYKSITLLIASVLFSAFGKAQVISLDSVLSAIERQNPMLQEYDHKIRAYQSYQEGAKGWMAPMVGAGTFMTPYSTRADMHDQDKGSIMFSFEQEIPNPAKLNANKNYLGSQALIAEQGKATKFNLLRSEAKTAYFRWIVAEEKIKVIRENERTIQLMLQLARIRYSYNQGTLGNVYQAEGRLAEVQNMMVMVKGDMEEYAYRLTSLMNLPPNTPMMVDTTLAVSFEPSIGIPDTAALGLQRSDIHQIDQTIESMRLSQHLQKVNAKPDFKFRFDHMQPLGDMPAQFTAMAMVSIPIAPWSSKMYRSEVKGMQYDIDAMKKEREAILLETQGMVAGMAARLTRMKTQLDTYANKIIPALKKNYQTLMIAYEENREQFPVVIDAWEALSMAELNYLEKKEEYFTMIVTYEKELEK